MIYGYVTFNGATIDRFPGYIGEVRRDTTVELSRCETLPKGCGGRDGLALDVPKPAQMSQVPCALMLHICPRPSVRRLFTSGINREPNENAWR